MAQMMCNRIWDVNPFQIWSQKGAEISGGSLASCVNKAGSTSQILKTQEPT